MTAEERQKLRGYYLSLNGAEQNLRDTKSQGKVLVLDEAVGDAIAEETERLEADFPALGLSSGIRKLRKGQSGSSGPYYPIDTMLMKVSLALGRIRAALESEDSTPVTETKEFGFIQDLALRKILERDYVEIQRASLVQCWKSVIILAGGAIEAILLDRLLQHEARAQNSAKRPTKEPNLKKWGLHHLIAVSVDLKLVTEGVERLSSPVREYRNLVHPGNELEKNLTFAKDEADIARGVLNIVHRDLSGSP